MFDESIIRNLKQVNVSVDAEKTRQRTTEVWKAADKEAQETILALAGVTRSTVQRAYKTGNISAKLVVPIAQTLDVNPHYLTGEADERGACSGELLREFLSQHKYDALLTGQGSSKQTRQRTSGKQAKPSAKPTMTPESGTEEIENEQVVVAAECEHDATTAAIDSDKQAFIDSMTEDDMILLMRSILLRAKAGGANAELANKLKLLLLS